MKPVRAVRYPHYSYENHPRDLSLPLWACELADHEDPPGGHILPHWHCAAFENGKCWHLHRTEQEAVACEVKP